MEEGRPGFGHKCRPDHLAATSLFTIAIGKRSAYLDHYVRRRVDRKRTITLLQVFPSALSKMNGEAHERLTPLNFQRGTSVHLAFLELS